jgi:hypothetical protein
MENKEHIIRTQNQIQKKIKKQLLKEPNDVGLNYVMAKLSIVRGYTAYDPPIGYKFNADAERYFLALSDEKELKKLKKPFVLSYYSTTVSSLK